MCKATLQKAVDLANGQTELARGIRVQIPSSKIGQVTVWGWLNGKRKDVPPADVVIPICAFLDWQITPHELRADIYPNLLDGMPTEQAQAA